MVIGNMNDVEERVKQMHKA